VLRNADLTDVRGLRAKQLQGTDLTGAKLPEPIEDSLKSLPGVDEGSKNSRKLFVTMSIACLYCWLTILSTTDAALLLGSSALALPIIQTPIPVATFFIAAPVLLLVVYIYLQFSLQSVWEAFATLPAIFPDGRPLHERAYPWFMNSIVRTRFPLLRKNCPALPRFQALVGWLLAWWFVPFTLLAFWARYIVRHRWPVTFFHVFVISVVFWLARWFWSLAKSALDGAAISSVKWYKFPLRLTFWRRAVPLILVCVVLTLVSLDALFGQSDVGDKNRVSTRLLSFIGWNPRGNLDGVNFSTGSISRTKDETGRLEGAQLAGAVLRDVSAAHVFAANANLEDADLSGAMFFHADLHNANLRGAKLSLTFFPWTDLRNADLSDVKIEGKYRQPIFEGANLEGATIFISARFFEGKKEVNEKEMISELKSELATVDRAHNWTLAHFGPYEALALGLPGNHDERLARRDFSDYDFAKLQEPGMRLSFEGGNLSGFNLQRAVLIGADLTHAILSAADFRGANLEGADLSAANIEGADLRGVDLTSVNGLSFTQYQSAKTDTSTKLPDYLQRQLSYGKPNHKAKASP